MSQVFKIGIVVDVVPINALSRDWEYFEVPASIHGDATLSEKEWLEYKKMYLADGRPTPVTSHLLGPGNMWRGASGEYYDRELLEFSLARTINRMSQLGVKYLGAWGGHFRCQDGFDRNTAIDQAISTINIAADFAAQYGMEIALEPQAEQDTLFPRYLEGVEFAKRTGRKNVKVMADLNYFLELDQPLEDILKYPGYCLNVHVQGDGGAQPNVGNRKEVLLHLFRVLKDAGYDKGVSAACPWVSTREHQEPDFRYETDITLAFLRDLREKVYH
ncbi:MAG: sugar phosphate isomerase/epimerase [Spirochaetaceae bacterium]|jgi:sugar phosphate isomerase/epimerase|nr:sugar phosphate isomerase/epimerase [Spirochaetaceae bacterium]